MSLLLTMLKAQLLSLSAAHIVRTYIVMFGLFYVVYFSKVSVYLRCVVLVLEIEASYYRGMLLIGH